MSRPFPTAGGRAGPVVGLVLFLLAPLSSRAADDLVALERTVLEAAKERTRLAQDWETRGREVSQLADEITRQQAQASGTRASRPVEERLQAFDRLVAQLDGFDRRLKAQQRVVAQAQARFEAAADLELARLMQKGASAPAATSRDLRARAEAVEAARGRVRSSAALDPTTRPALEITLAPEDGPLEIEAKRALLAAERQRLVEAGAALERELAVVEGRLGLKRRLVREIEAAGEGGAGLPLVMRQADDLHQALQELEGQRQRLVDGRAQLPRVLRQIDERAATLERRARELTPRNDRSPSP
jgi:hypothetical protein